MSGYWAVGSLLIATAPAIVIRIAMTIATIGRRTKKAPTGLLPCLFRRLRLGSLGRGAAGFLRHDRHPGPHPLEPLDHDLVSRLQSFLDDPEVAIDDAGLHDLDRDLVVGSHHAHLVTALELRNGALRHED